MADDLFVMMAIAAGTIAMFQAGKANEQVKKLQAQLAALRAELKLPPVDLDPRDANRWKIQWFAWASVCTGTEHSIALQPCGCPIGANGGPSLGMTLSWKLQKSGDAGRAATRLARAGFAGAGERAVAPGGAALARAADAFAGPFALEERRAFEAGAHPDVGIGRLRL